MIFMRGLFLVSCNGLQHGDSGISFSSLLNQPLSRGNVTPQKALCWNIMKSWSGFLLVPANGQQPLHFPLQHDCPSWPELDLQRSKQKTAQQTHGSKSLCYTQQWPKLPLCYFVSQLPGKTLTHWLQSCHRNGKTSGWEAWKHLICFKASHGEKSLVPPIFETCETRDSSRVCRSLGLFW